VALPFMHASDTLEAMWGLLTAPRAALSRRVYNVGAVSASPREWAAAFGRAAAAAAAPPRHQQQQQQRRAEARPGGTRLRVNYAPDHRDAIARSWPAAVDFSAARRDWGFAPSVCGVDAMATRLLSELIERRRAAAGADAAVATAAERTGVAATASAAGSLSLSHGLSVGVAA
jgi:nucleoside-diphosphate-sugar epimerase